MLPRLSRRELALQQEQTLEQYKDLVLKEAERRLKGCRTNGTNVTHWHRITKKGDFEHDVQMIVDDTLAYA